MTNPPSVGAGAGGTVLVEFASSSRHLDLDVLMEAVLAEAMKSGWIEDAFLAQSGSQRTAMWEVRETIPEGEKRRNGSVKHDISVPLSAIQRFLDLAGSQVRSYDADLELSVYGHVGDGNLHYNVLVPPDVDRIEFTNRIESGLSLQLYRARPRRSAARSARNTASAGSRSIFWSGTATWAASLRCAVSRPPLIHRTS